MRHLLHSHRLASNIFEGWKIQPPLLLCTPFDAFPHVIFSNEIFVTVCHLPYAYFSFRPKYRLSAIIPFDFTLHLFPPPTPGCVFIWNAFPPSTRLHIVPQSHVEWDPSFITVEEVGFSTFTLLLEEKWINICVCEWSGNCLKRTEIMISYLWWDWRKVP